MRPLLRPPACHSPHHQVTGESNQDLLLANRRPPIMWASTVLGWRSLSGLVCPSMDRLTGTAVARAEAPHPQPESLRPEGPAAATILVFGYCRCRLNTDPLAP
jgi:hypothetical protein